jgi:hypothetical protein
MHPTVDGVILPPVKGKGRRGRNMKLRLVLLLALMTGTFAADAAGTKADVRKTIENSMLVTGTIDIGIDGAAIGHRLDQPEKLPAFVRDLVTKAATEMRFEPVLLGGKPVKARAKMGVRVVARKLENGNYQLRIASTSFGEQGGDDAESVTKEKMRPPEYPMVAAMRNVGGTVYLVLKIGRQGAVEDLAVEQVNLTVLGNERQMEQSRKWLAEASVDAARKWKFRFPTRGESADDSFWSLRVPVAFLLRKQKEPAYGQWDAYIPGPHASPAWIDADEARQNPDAMIAGDLYQIGRGPKLVTPSQG